MRNNIFDLKGKYLLLLAGLFFMDFVKAQSIKSGRIIFYNTENLFDTIDDPKTIDEEFTPLGKSHWTSERYLQKLAQISKVLSAMANGSNPIVIGLAEIENRGVVEDLIHTGELQKNDWGIIQKESPDPRGIDAVFLYNKKLFTPEGSEFLTVTLPGEEKHTRDIVYVYGKVNGATIHFFVNHWPSRRSGKEASEEKRAAAAQVLHNRIEQVLTKDKNANIVVMGDLNDNPTDASIVSVLGVQQNNDKPQNGNLYDLMTKPFQEGKFTLKFKDEGDLFDQFIVSGSLLKSTIFPSIQKQEGVIFNPEWLTFHHEKNGDMPNRTFSGPKYHATGFSDHYPVYTDLIWGGKKKKVSF